MQTKHVGKTVQFSSAHIEPVSTPGIDYDENAASLIVILILSNAPDYTAED